MSQVSNTIQFLRARIAARSAGYPVSYTTDPRWLVNMAVNRRAGWPDDPTCSRGSAMPVNGCYPKRGSGDSYHHLCTIARDVNTPRLIVRPGQLGEWRRLILARIPDRITVEE